jgi:hypothetical protein
MPVVSGLSLMDEVSPIITQLAGLESCQYVSIWLGYGGDLCWAKSEQNGHNQAKSCLREGSCGRLANRGCNTKTHQQDRVESRAPEVDGTSAQVRCKDPGKHDEDGLQSGGNQAKCERSFNVNSSLCGYVSIVSYQRDRSWVPEAMNRFDKIGWPSNANLSIFLGA